jgi:hypothetical protein
LLYAKLKFSFENITSENNLSHLIINQKTISMKTFLPLVFISFFISVSFAQENGGPYSSDANTALLMHFDGNAMNSANIGANGIAHGSGVSYESGIHGQCLRLDNTTASKQSWIEVPCFDELNATSNGLAVECWFKLNSWGENSTGTCSLFRKDGSDWMADYEIILWPEVNEGRHGQVNLNCEDEETQNWGADAPIADILELNTWYYIVIYYNPHFKHEYVTEEGDQRQASSVYCLIRDENFEEIFASRGHTETLPTNSEGLFRIGFGGSEDSYFDGWIDELRISNSYRKYRDDVLANVDISSFKDSVFLPLKDKWTVYQWPLAEYYPFNEEKGDIERANACGPTMLTRGIHYWEYPRFPKGAIEHDWVGLDWYAEFDNTEYLWDLMPETFGANTTEEVYGPAALLSAQVGVASRKTYDNMYCMPKFLKENFLFSKKTRIVFEEEYTKEEWENIIRNELSNGRICMVGGWGHYYIINGYNSKNQFFTDYSFNDFYWKDIKEFDYGAMQDMIIYMEPDWGNKKLKLKNPVGDKWYKSGDEIEISWTAENISNLIIEYTSDAGKNWNIVSDNIDASLGKYIWVAPENESGKYKVRISDSENLNVYRKTEIFELYNQKDFAFEYPKQNTKFRKATQQPVYWQANGINSFKLEYSVNNQNWVVLSDSINGKSGSAMVNLPNVESENIKLKATDLENDRNVYTSESFNLISDQLWGGPYIKDDKTLLLMHFENDLSNEVHNQLIPNELNPIGIYEENYNKNLGKAFRVFNPSNYAADAIHLKNSENLDLGNNWTMETWVKVASIMGERTAASLIINKWDAFNISAGWQHFGASIIFENGTNVEFYHPQGYQLNQWYHVAMISNASEEKIYFYVHDKNYNEIYKDVKNFPAGSNGQIAQNENIVTIGGLGGGSNLELDGYLDELRITKSVANYETMIVGIDNIYAKERTLNLQCFPNPITSESLISFQTQASGNVDLSVFDMQGRKICTLINKKLHEGQHSIRVSNSSFTNGIYLCKLTTIEGISTKKLIVNPK